MRRLLCLVFLLLTGPIAVPVQGSPPLTTASVAQAAPATTPPGDFAAMVREAREQVESASYTRLEIFIGGLGALMTIIVLFFAINTRSTAINEAKASVEKERKQFKRAAKKARGHTAEAQANMEEIRTQLQGVRDERKASQEAFELFAAAVNKRVDSVFAEIEELKRSAAASVEKIEASGVELQEKIRHWMDDGVLPRALAASEAATPEEGGMPIEKKADRDLDESEFSVRIADAAATGNYSEVHELAILMRRLLPADSAQVYARFAEGWALDAMGRSEEALSAYDRAVDLFKDKQDPLVLDWVAKAWLNKGVILGALEQPMDAIAAFDELVAQFGTSEDSGIQAQVAKALVNKGYRLEQLNQPEEALAVYGGVVDRFRASDEFEAARQVGFALFASAGIAASKGEVDEAIALLRQWTEKRGEFDAEWIAADPRFDKIRGHPRLTAFLTEMAATSAAQSVEGQDAG